MFKWAEGMFSSVLMTLLSKYGNTIKLQHNISSVRTHLPKQCGQHQIHVNCAPKRMAQMRTDAEWIINADILTQFFFHLHCTGYGNPNPFQL